LTKDGQAPKSGNTIIMTYEPNFGTSAKMRISTKDLFRSGVTPDRVFAFAASDRWGTAKLAAAGHLPPLPVRLYSGTCRGGYTMEFVQQLDQVKIEAKPHGDRQYIVEIAVPWKELGINPKPGLKLRGDFGVTYSDPAGKDTNLRVYWSNKATGIVADEVEELKLQPALWGEFDFE
jgi:hypothetical protein